MLFQEQREKRGMTQKEVMYYAGAFVVDFKKRIIGLLTGIKQADGNIRYDVTYHYRNRLPETKKQGTLNPVDFEKFIQKMSQQIENTVCSHLTEFHYRLRPLNEDVYFHLDEQDMENIHQVYLLSVISGDSRKESLEQAQSLLKKIKKQYV